MAEPACRMFGHGLPNGAHADGRARRVESTHRDREALALGANDVVLRDAHILKVDGTRV